MSYKNQVNDLSNENNEETLFCFLLRQNNYMTVKEIAKAINIQETNVRIKLNRMTMFLKHKVVMRKGKRGYAPARAYAVADCYKKTNGLTY